MTNAEGHCEPDSGAIPQLPEGAWQEALSFLKSEEARKTTASLFGAEFFDILKEAPCEYATLTLLGHIAIMFPVGSLLLLESCTTASSKWKSWTQRNTRIMDSYRTIYHPLAPSLASANHSACEFKGLTCLSWHGLVCQYVAEANKAIEVGIKAGPTTAMKMLASTEGKAEMQKAKRNLQRKGYQPSDAIIDMVTLFFHEWAGAESGLKSQGLEVTEDDLTKFAIHLQQELPRAWTFKYGVGNTDFLRFEDAAVEVMESYVIPGRAVGPRNTFFRKCKGREGLGPARIAKKWNAMSPDERRNIAPMASGKVTAATVKKALQRDKKKIEGTES